MATLVLTAVGSAVGGPIGGAIGALIGQSVDHALFGPKRREGPRLVELAVQTSSYGAQIPKLFGTMRVAGTVIWATDLIESRASSRAGKGQPSTSTYSYAASFAVLLSARAIRGVGRIWAEGKLLRGAAGDFKTATGFRLHLGGEDQAVDPLIASAEGVATPAYRGAAYAVFEMLQLADFGNRIPSLTFEVIADEGSVLVSTIAKALAGEVSGTTALAVGGFAASGGSVRAVLEMLGQAGGAWFAPVGCGLVMRDAAGATVVVADEGFAVGGKGVRRARALAAIETVPRTVTVGYYDAARDYQAGLQRARRPGAGVRDLSVEVPAVLEAGAAKTVAEAMLARAEAGRVRRTVAAGFGAMGLAPGACVTIAGEGGGVWRVADVSIEGMVTTLGLVPLVTASLPATATSGRVSGAVDAVVGATILRAIEVPGLEEAPLSAPRMTVVAAGSGAAWRQAALLYSVNDGVSWVAAGATAAPAVIGTIVVAAPSAPATLVDLRGAFEVVLAHAEMELGEADAAALDRGVNLALLGDELVQFGRAEPLGGARWRLSQLLRGRRGTEAATGVQKVGERFVLLETGAARAFDLPVSVLGREVRVIASGVGDDAAVETRCVMRGASVVPPSPVHLRFASEADGSATVRWTRRSRAGWRWIDGVDVPLAEEVEAYRVTVTAGGTSRDVDVAEPFVSITAAERVGSVSIAVRQRGVFGESLAANLIVPELIVPA
ncbi:putative tail protein [Sphingomonas sp. PP-CE-1A-559]|uniref:phage tail protein n=1 Tax=Sphingomonas sp. PP-CE-1A-559 TaxID=2135657 RepID=UPI001056B9F5|nr:phage tail protein [Sphingomonas sp. PP-CE-1A-559]TCP93727.1 putative tail protein [Sphingomonas sp. PP-CE-1A-559]